MTIVAMVFLFGSKPLSDHPTATNGDGQHHLTSHHTTFGTRACALGLHRIAHLDSSNRDQ